MKYLAQVQSCFNFWGSGLFGGDYGESHIILKTVPKVDVVLSSEFRSGAAKG